VKITRVRWAPYCIPFQAPYVTSQGTATEREGLIIRVETEDGRTGLGEAAMLPESPDAAPDLERALRRLAPPLHCRPLDVIEVIDPSGDDDVEAEAAAAIACALDTALCDLLAQARDESMARLLSADAASSVPINALISSASLPATLEAAGQAREAGFSAVKLKVGVAPDLELEVERVRSVREVIGPEIRLRLDPNGAWTERQAVEACEAFVPYDIEYIEQPLPPGNLEAMSRLQAAVNTAIAADEDVTDLETALRIIETGAARVLVLKPQRLGGPRATRRIIEAAAAAGLRCLITTSIETGIGTAACLQIAATLPPGSPASGLATAGLLEHHLTTPELRIVRGVMRLPSTAGLGLQLDEAASKGFLGEWRG
jgi:L-Ala-D/L-Glu epimerase